MSKNEIMLLKYLIKDTEVEATELLLIGLLDWFGH